MEECSQRAHQPSTVPGGNAEIDATVQEKAAYERRQFRPTKCLPLPSLHTGGFHWERDSH